MKRLREELESMFRAFEKEAPRPVFKRSKANHSLLTTDALRRVKDAQGLEKALAEAGYRVLFENGVWHIEPPIAFYKQPRPFLKGEMAGSLHRLLCLHPTDERDCDSARLIIKAMETKETEAAIKAALSLQARKLRLKEPLDGLLLRLFDKEESKC